MKTFLARTFLASLSNAVWNRETVNIGGGTFNYREVAEVIAVLRACDGIQEPHAAIEKARQALLIALPYVEAAQSDPTHTLGKPVQHAELVRSALASLGEAKP